MFLTCKRKTTLYDRIPGDFLYVSQLMALSFFWGSIIRKRFLFPLGSAKLFCCFSDLKTSFLEVNLVSKYNMLFILMNNPNFAIILRDFMLIDCKMKKIWKFFW